MDSHIGQPLFLDGEVTSGHGTFLCCKQLLPNMQWPKIGTRQRPAIWYKCTLHENAGWRRGMGSRRYDEGHAALLQNK
jgi:hypothetical protein